LKKLTLRLLLVIAGALLALYVAEQVLRLVGWEYRPLSVQVRDRGDARGFHLFNDNHFVYDPRLLWRPKPDFGVFNSLGLRGPEVTRDRSTAELRVITVGDSNTLGWAGEDGANWPESLGKRLRALGTEVKVVNAGVWGYSSAQGLARLEEVLPYQPDLVLISFGSNDAHRVSRSDREFAEGSQWLRRLSRWLTHYRVGQLVAVSFRGGSTTGELIPRVPLDRYRENLRRMSAMVRSAGARPVFMTRPFTGTINDPLVWKNFAFDYNAVTVEVAIEEAAMVIDLYSYYKGRPEFFSDESHFTADGHRLAAEIVANHVNPFLSDLEREKTFRRQRAHRNRLRGQQDPGT
jgi:lysophospholipase L1-like esterase